MTEGYFENKTCAPSEVPIHRPHDHKTAAAHRCASKDSLPSNKNPNPSHKRLPREEEDESELSSISISVSFSSSIFDLNPNLVELFNGGEAPAGACALLRCLQPPGRVLRVRPRLRKVQALAHPERARALPRSSQR